MPHILLQSLKFQRKSLIFWTIGIVALIAMYIALYPSIKDSAAELNAYINKLPQTFRDAFISSETNYATPLGYISSEIYSQMLPILFLFFAIGFGSNAVAGEEEKGTLDVVLSAPVRRSQFLVEKFFALAICLIFLSLLIIVSLYFGSGFVGITLTIEQLFSATFLLFLLGLNFGMVAFFIGSLTGSKALAIGLTTAFAVLSFLVNTFYKMVTVLDKVKEFSPFYQYSSHNSLLHGVDWTHATIFLLTTLALLALSIVVFAKRDLDV